jgi:hypothetical protein
MKGRAFAVFAQDVTVKVGERPHHIGHAADLLGCDLDLAEA